MCVLAKTNLLILDLACELAIVRAREKAEKTLGRMELIGSRDAVVAGLGPQTPIRPLDSATFTMEKAWDSFLDRFAPAYRAELASFVEVAAGRASSACTARDGLEAMRIAEAASRSLAEGRKVALQDIDVGGEKEVRPDFVAS